MSVNYYLFLLSNLDILNSVRFLKSSSASFENFESYKKGSMQQTRGEHGCHLLALAKIAVQCISVAGCLGSVTFEWYFARGGSFSN